LNRIVRVENDVVMKLRMSLALCWFVLWLRYCR